MDKNTKRDMDKAFGIIIIITPQFSCEFSNASICQGGSLTTTSQTQYSPHQTNDS
jgi:hypothetical protein